MKYLVFVDFIQKLIYFLIYIHFSFLIVILEKGPVIGISSVFPFYTMQAFTFLKNRGLVYQSSHLLEEALKSLSSTQSIYLGVDPTAKGLHIGHLMAFRALKRFHESGVKSIALVFI